mgnify:CR=1 FL=1
MTNRETMYICADCGFGARNPLELQKHECRERPDIINHPAHYTAGKVECIDAIEAATEGLEGIQAVCTGNVIKYIWRWNRKGGVQDLYKCRWYLDRLIKDVERVREGDGNE